MPNTVDSDGIATQHGLPKSQPGVPKGQQGLLNIHEAIKPVSPIKQGNQSKQSNQSNQSEQRKPSVSRLGRWSKTKWLLHRSKAYIFALLVLSLIIVIGYMIARTYMVYGINACGQRRSRLIVYGLLELIIGYGFATLIWPHLPFHAAGNFTGKTAIARRLNDLGAKDQEKAQQVEKAEKKVFIGDVVKST